jgi:hypothetical protein
MGTVPISISWSESENQSGNEYERDASQNIACLHVSWRHDPFPVLETAEDKCTGACRTEDSEKIAAEVCYGKADTEHQKYRAPQTKR